MTIPAQPMTVAQAAEALGVTPDRVRKLIRSGRLAAVRFGNAYMVDRDSVKAFRHRRPGRPPKAT